MIGSRLHLVGGVIVSTLVCVVCSITPQPGLSGNDPVVSNTLYSLQIYNSINSYRSKHIAPALKWNRTLNEIAENLAIELVTPPNTPTDPEDLEGVNYFETKGGKPQVNRVVNTWYNESSLYNYDNPSFSHSYLNFTQMVWKSSKSVGIGTATYNNVSIVIARFFPAGNINGAFRVNVIPIRKVYR